jgi:hypothetical protein
MDTDSVRDVPSGVCVCDVDRRDIYKQRNDCKNDQKSLPG